jgi:hypothetical protein
MLSKVGAGPVDLFLHPTHDDIVNSEKVFNLPEYHYFRIIDTVYPYVVYSAYKSIFRDCGVKAYFASGIGAALDYVENTLLIVAMFTDIKQYYSFLGHVILAKYGALIYGFIKILFAIYKAITTPSVVKSKKQK